MDIREHINKATGNALKHHRVIEGGCNHGGVYYLMFGNMKKKTTIICKVKEGEEKKVLGVSKPLKIGHANDCCISGSIIYVTHSGEKNVIHRVSANTLEKLPDVYVTGCKGGFNAITCFGTGFLVKKMASRKCYVLDDLLRYKKTITLSTTMKVGQGMHWDPKRARLFRASSVGQSKKNYVCVYKANGKLVKKYHYKHKCELEDVMTNSAGHVVMTIYRKKKTKQGKKFRAHLKTLVK